MGFKVQGLGSEIGIAQLLEQTEQFLGRPFAKSLGPQAEFIKSVLGGFGPINFCTEFGLAAIAFEQSLGRPFASSLGPKAEFIKSALGGLGFRIWG